MKTVTFAGISRLDGVLKFRTANDTKRIEQLIKLGDKEVDIRPLPSAMTKSQAAKHLLATNAFPKGSEAESLLVANATDDNPFKAPKKAKTVKVTVPTKFAQELLGAKVKVEPVEDDIKLSPKQAAKIRAEFMKKLKAAYEAN
jgi:hypothetical protein